MPIDNDGPTVKPVQGGPKTTSAYDDEDEAEAKSSVPPSTTFLTQDPTQPIATIGGRRLDGGKSDVRYPSFTAMCVVRAVCTEEEAEKTNGSEEADHPPTDTPATETAHGPGGTQGKTAEGNDSGSPPRRRTRRKSVTIQGLHAPETKETTPLPARSRRMSRRESTCVNIPYVIAATATAPLQPYTDENISTGNDGALLCLQKTLQRLLPSLTRKH